MSSKKNQNRKLAYLALLGNALIWGVCLPWVKKGLAETTPMTFLFYRYFFACLTCLPILICCWKKLKPPNFKAFLELSLLGVFNTLIAHWFLYEGLEKTTALESSIITSLTPVFVILGAWLILREKIEKQEKTGIALTFIGSIFIIIEPVIFQPANGNFNHSLGNFLVLTYVIIWMLSILWMKKLSQKYHAFTITYVSFFVSIIGFAILAFLENPDFLKPIFFSQPYAFSASLYMGTLGSVAALYLYQYGQEKIEASEATLFTYLQTLFAIPITIVWLKEVPSLFTVISGIVIIVGVIVAEKK